MTPSTQSPTEPPRFLCDAMLGSLARWLRFFGFDTSYPEPGPKDNELAEWARIEDRWLLTRDRDLAAVGPRTMLIVAEVLEDQLVEVFSRLGLRPPPTLGNARCGQCNGELKETTREEVSELAPPHVLETSPRFRQCLDCGRVYWPGTHSKRILDRMNAVSKKLEL